MAKKTNVTKTMHQRRAETLDNIRHQGRKVHQAAPGSVEERRQNVQRVFLGTLDEEGRYPDTAENSPERKRKRGRVVKLVAGIAVTASSFATSVVGDMIAPDPVVHDPANHLPDDVAFIDGELQLRNQKPDNGVQLGSSDQRD